MASKPLFFKEGSPFFVMVLQGSVGFRNRAYHRAKAKDCAVVLLFFWEVASFGFRDVRLKFRGNRGRSWG